MRGAERPLSLQTQRGGTQVQQVSPPGNLIGRQEITSLSPAVCVHARASVCIGCLCVHSPRLGHYFPDLHHLRYEVEEGTTADGRAVRFGYQQQDFPGFSWRGYAQMSAIQVGTRPANHLPTHPTIIKPSIHPSIRPATTSVQYLSNHPSNHLPIHPTFNKPSIYYREVV